MFYFNKGLKLVKLFCELKMMLLCTVFNPSIMKNIFLFVALSLLLIACTSKKEKAIQYNKSGIKNMFNLKNKEAMADFTLAIELDPTFDQPYYYRGNLKYSSGDYQGALADYTKAIEANPGFTDAYNNRGNLYQALNKQENACADWRKAHDLGRPNLEDKLRFCQ
jgi:tetratricopeptide (TPR) repeat protein